MTINLYKRGDFYNPLFVDTVRGRFELTAIRFFKKDGVVVDVSHGWLEDENGHHLGPYNLEGIDELPIKRKPDLAFGKPFLLHIGKESYHQASDRRFPELKSKHGKLYIPFVRQDWMITEQVCGGPLSKEYRKKFVHKDGFCLNKHIKSVELKENIEFYDKISEIPKILGLNADINHFHVFEQTDDGMYVKDKKLISKLKDIVDNL